MGTSVSTVKSSSSSNSGGNTSSMISSALTSNAAKREKHVKKKIDYATKTGVLNLADLTLKGTHTVWLELAAPELITRIRTLDLSGNPLKAIPVEVYGLSNLKSLFLTNCQLQYTNDLLGLTHLSKLKLDHNDLEIDKVRNLPVSVTLIDLSYNHLVGIPATLSPLINLISLDLNHNRIESIYGIEALVGLVTLNLDDNLLTELPESICILVKLRKISLARNRFTKNSVNRPGQQSIPSGLLENSEVDHIDLTGNVSITKADVLRFTGIERFMQRRQAIKDKNFQGGALSDVDLFGLE